MTTDTERAWRPRNGIWSGTYEQDGDGHPTRTALRFREGAIRGKGEDGSGKFTLEGTYDPETSRGSWEKQYRRHTVQYDGHFEIGESGRPTRFDGTWTVDTLTGSVVLAHQPNEVDPTRMEAWLDKKLSGYDFKTEYSESPPSIPVAKVVVTEAGPWTWICVTGCASGDNDTPWSDSWSNHWYKGVTRDWVGLTATRPTDPKPSTLNSWAHERTSYTYEDWQFELTDIRRSHKGSWVRSIAADGTLVIADARKPSSSDKELTDAAEDRTITLSLDEA